ncbi:protein N-terminal glutamine amidohydrolase [Quillaja saponaria]|uniref:Protein N-terminal glutamine amidohydrolase n=1 Tax=Quillaja saponaria TaxID=32244 RepID=A0AAD7Q8M4_QUISA|nr:protein N-terminal glutamine amidohydrolase [Quillaja saponaria]
MTTSTLEQSKLDVSHFNHTPFYCEENVYFLCKQLCGNGVADAEGSDLFVIFISNEKRQIPLWHQKASRRADGVILWDYHVICIQRKSSGDPLVWDLDSTLSFPSSLAPYVSETIRPSFQLFSEYRRFFRIVHAPLFLRCFASDRRHMKEPDGTWTAEPPIHKPIVAEDGTKHNLNEYLEIRPADVISNASSGSIKDAVFTQKLGVVVNENQLEEFFSQLP